MKKIIMLVCFVVNGALLAMDRFDVNRVIFNGSSYTYDKVEQCYTLANTNSLYDTILPSCADKEGRLVPERVTAYFENFVQEASRRGVKMGKQSVRLKQVIMKSSRTQKFGYACVGACAVWGFVQIACAIKNKLNAKKNDK